MDKNTENVLRKIAEANPSVTINFQTMVNGRFAAVINLSALIEELDDLRRINGQFKSAFSEEVNRKVHIELGTQSLLKPLVEALEQIADKRKRHREPDEYTELGCVMGIAFGALCDYYKAVTPFSAGVKEVKASSTESQPEGTLALSTPLDPQREWIEFPKAEST